ncbi:MAG: Ig-like domain-containing protein [Alsobacter sp.]
MTAARSPRPSPSPWPAAPPTATRSPPPSPSTNTNDAPVLTSAALTLSEGATVVLAAADIGITDPDSTAFTTTVSGVTHGSFETLVGATWGAATSFTSAQLAAGGVAFVHDGSEIAPTFSTTPSARHRRQQRLAATVTFSNTNDAPVLTSTALTLSEGATVVLAAADIGITDPDSTAFTYTVSAHPRTAPSRPSSAPPGEPPRASPSAQLAAGEVRFVHDGSEIAPTFSLTANGTADSNTLAATVTFSNTNDARPHQRGLTLSKSATVVLAAADIGITDPDSTAFTYTVSGTSRTAPSRPSSRLATWGAATKASPQRSSPPAVRFVHDGSEIAPTFSLTANDGTADSNTLAATVTFSNTNDAPTLTAFSAPVASTNEDTQATISFADLQAQGDEADVDGTVTAFVVKAVTSGTLKIGADAGTAQDWAAGTNDVIDATHQAFWTPASNANGTLDAFTVVAQDNDGAVSATAIGTKVTVAPVADPPNALGPADLTDASDSGISKTDDLTNVATPTFSGSGAIAGATVTLLEGATVLGFTQANPSGNWQITSSTLSQGPHFISVTQTTADGTSQASAPLTVTIDTTALAPSAPDLTNVSDSGTLATDNITNVTLPTLTGSGAEAGATVTLYDDNGTTVLGSAVANAGGGWSITPTNPLGNGDHVLTVKQTDIAGNVSGASASLTVTIDTSSQAPSGLDLAAVDDTGASNTDNITSLSSGLTISGLGETGATVTLFDDVNASGTLDLGEAILATALVNGGAFSTDIALTVGTHHVAAYQTDVAGNKSAASTLDITVTSAAPAAPTGLNLLAADDKGTSNSDDITNQTTALTIRGNGQSGATVQVFEDVNTNGLFDAADALLGTTTVASNGIFSTDVALSQGTHAIRAVQTVSGSDPSSASSALVIKVDTTAPTVTSVSYGFNDGTLRAGESVTLLVAFSEVVNLSGGTPTLTLTGGGTATYAGGTGTDTLSFIYTVAAGQNTVDLAVTGFNLNGASLIDTAGNTAIVTGALTNPAGLLAVDTTNPNAPGSLDLATEDDTGPNTSDNITTQSTGLTITGVAETGATVTLFDDANNNGVLNNNEAVLATTVASGGSFSTDIALSLGTHNVRAFQTDVAGNRGAVSSALAITVTAAAPNAPTGLDLATADDTGPNTADNVTRNTSALTITGSGVTGATVQIFDDTNNNGVRNAGETLLATTTVIGGTFSADVALGAGAHNVRAIQTVAGLSSVSSDALVITVDTTAPTVTSVTYGSNDGTLKAGESVTLYVAFSEPVTVVGGVPSLTLNSGGLATYASGSGTNTLAFTYTVGANQNTADLGVTGFSLNGAGLTDFAGNAAVTAGIITNPAGTLIVDTIAPTAPGGLDLAAADDNGASSTDNITSLTTGLTISGTGQNGATVTLFDDANNNAVLDGSETVLGSKLVSGGAFSTDIALSLGTHNIRAFQTDVAGNVSPVSGPLAITIIQSGPPAPTGLNLAASDDTGVSNSDDVTSKVSALTITGSAPNASSIRLFDDANNNGLFDQGEALLGTATVNGGTFTRDISLADGLHHVRAIALDASAAAGPASAALDITIDTTAPQTLVSSASLSASKITLSGTSNEGLVAVYDNGAYSGTATVTAGSWSFTTGTLSNSVHTFTFTDIAGNANSGTSSMIYGSTGANAITGTSGNDVIYGGSGDDNINSGAGSDVMTGGPGNDHFVFRNFPSGGSLDHVTDFSSGDILDMARSVFGNGLALSGNTGTLAASHFAAGTAATAATAQFIYDAASGTLYFDPDGTGAAAKTAVVTLDNHYALKNTDIHMV